jgi:hypothetical protein
MKTPSAIKKSCLWRYFHFRGPWHFAYYRPEVDPPATNPPPRRYKNWRAICGSQFTLDPAEERPGSPPQDSPVCQRCLRVLTAG